MPEFSRQLEQTLVGLRAAVGKEAFARAEASDDFRREPALRFGEIQIGNVNQLPGLLDEGLGDGRMRVAQTAHGNAAAEIKVALARHVENVTAQAVAQNEIESAIAGNDIPCKQFPHRLVLVVDERRR